MSQTEQVFQGIMKELARTRGDLEEMDKVFESIPSRLPEGEAKNFFLEIAKILSPIEEIVEKQDESRLGEVREAVRSAQDKLRHAPESVPPDIVKSYGKYLSLFLVLIAMLS
jgi:hypothetical protein